MAEVTQLMNLIKGISPDASAEYLAKISKQLYFMLNYLDSKNIESIETNITNVYNGDGDKITDDNGNIVGDLIVGNIVVTQSLYAEDGYISRLTVDELLTEDKVQRYLASDTTDVEYIHIFDQFTQFKAATTDGLSTEQALSREGDPLYWTDDTFLQTTTDVTAYPTLVYVYDELTKMQIGFEEVDGVETPVITLGSGSGGAGTTNGKGFIYKGVDGLEQRYFNQLDNAARHQQHTEDDVIHVIGDEQSSNVFNKETEPSGVADGSIGINPRDRSLEGVQYFTDTGTIDAEGGRIVDCTFAGTTVLNLYSITTELTYTYLDDNPAFHLIIVNSGAGTITLTASTSPAETIEGAATLAITAGQRKVLWGYGTDWKVIS